MVQNWQWPKPSMGWIFHGYRWLQMKSQHGQRRISIVAALLIDNKFRFKTDLHRISLDRNSQKISPRAYKVYFGNGKD